MSTNYHAFQSRGYLFSTYEALCEQWHTTFSNYDPARISRILNLEYDEAYLYLTYFQTPYRLRLRDGWLEKKKENVWTDKVYFNETMSIYHLLYYTKDVPLVSHVWVPNTALERTARQNRRMPDPLLTPFARKFTGHTAKLEAACQNLGGVKFNKGEVAYEFAPFPQVHLQLIFWDADEDFPAQVQLLVDKQVTDFLHFETTGCIISDLLEKLEATL